MVNMLGKVCTTVHTVGISECPGDIEADERYEFRRMAAHDPSVATEGLTADARYESGLVGAGLSAGCHYERAPVRNGPIDWRRPYQPPVVTKVTPLSVVSPCRPLVPGLEGYIAARAFSGISECPGDIEDDYDAEEGSDLEC